MQIFPCSLTVKTINFKEMNNDNKVETAIAGLNFWASYATVFNLNINILFRTSDGVFPYPPKPDTIKSGRVSWS